MGEQMPATDNLSSSLERHYSPGGLAAAILAALQAAGKDPDHLTAEDLAPVDEFHVRGRRATLELAELAGLKAGMRVLDVGCGIGGPSRVLAGRYGCRVTGVDLCGEYCEVASMLAERLGLAHLVDYRQGDACTLPFADATFDLVWTQHVAMNVPDKRALYAGMARVLKPGGMLALYDGLQGGGGGIHYPVPWSRRAETSFLATPDGLRALLEEAGFAIADWRDVTGEGLEWFRSTRQRQRDKGPSPLGIHLLLGEEFPVMAGNLVRNMEEGRLILLEALAIKTTR